MSRVQHGYRVRAYPEKQCAHCHNSFTPRSGNAKNCDHCGDLRHRSALLPLPTRQLTRKPLIQDLAPDFLRALPALRAELERVAPLGSKLQSRDYHSVPLTELGCVRDRRGE